MKGMLPGTGLGLKRSKRRCWDPGQVSGDAYNVGMEKREAAIGKTDGGRIIFVVYTMRNEKVRPIHAREATSKEKGRYRS